MRNKYSQFSNRVTMLPKAFLAMLKLFRHSYLGIFNFFTSNVLAKHIYILCLKNSKAYEK